MCHADFWRPFHAHNKVFALNPPEVSRHYQTDITAVSIPCCNSLHARPLPVVTTFETSEHQCEPDNDIGSLDCSFVPAHASSAAAAKRHVLPCARIDRLPAIWNEALDVRPENVFVAVHGVEADSNRGIAGNEDRIFALWSTA